ncbi:MAG: bifunctional ADP-heptose synthase, partial [Lentimicrobiaceae bacterium]|nr:bifunctional ADP-heptose synthase [Lentimicrobiaceae bacterium]
MMRKKENIQKLFDDFSKLTVLIVGDVMLDDYILGDVSRISPEAPVPIVNITSRRACLGGAANVALNIKSLGAKSVLCSVIGEDKKSDDFLTIMQQERLDCHGIIKSKDRILTTKYRAIGNNMQLLRLDSEVTHSLSQNDEQRFCDTLLSVINTQSIDAVIFEDYDKGVITPVLINQIVAASKEKSIPIAVDPKKRNFLSYNNIDLFKPNWKELNEGLQIEKCGRQDHRLHDAVKQFMINKQHKHLLLTLSGDGVLIYCFENEAFRYTHIPAQVRNIADVSGAGDTVISVAVLCMAAGLEMEDIAMISNVAGGLVCEEVGVVAVN